MQKIKNEIVPHYDSHWDTQNQMRLENYPQCESQCATRWDSQNHMKRAINSAHKIHVYLSNQFSDLTLHLDLRFQITSVIEWTIFMLQKSFCFVQTTFCAFRVVCNLECKLHLQIWTKVFVLLGFLCQRWTLLTPHASHQEYKSYRIGGLRFKSPHLLRNWLL